MLLKLTLQPGDFRDGHAAEYSSEGVVKAGFDDGTGDNDNKVIAPRELPSSLVERAASTLTDKDEKY